MRNRVWSSPHGSMRIKGSSLADAMADRKAKPVKLRGERFPELLSQERRLAGLCPKCGNKTDDHVQCASCRERAKLKKREKKQLKESN